MIVYPDNLQVGQSVLYMDNGVERFGTVVEIDYFWSDEVVDVRFAGKPWKFFHYTEKVTLFA